MDPLLPLVLSLALALLFYMAARHKLKDNRRFQAQLAAYRILPAGLLPVAARALPLLEMGVFVMLLIPFTRAFAGLLAAGLLVMYALAMAINIKRGRSDIDCGCGDEPQALSAWLLLRNAVLAAGALLLLIPVAERGLYLMDMVFIVLLTAALSMAYLMVEQLVRNNAVLNKFDLNNQESK